MRPALTVNSARNVEIAKEGAEMTFGDSIIYNGLVKGLAMGFLVLLLTLIVSLGNFLDRRFCKLGHLLFQGFIVFAVTWAAAALLLAYSDPMGPEIPARSSLWACAATVLLMAWPVRNWWLLWKHRVRGPDRALPSSDVGRDAESPAVSKDSSTRVLPLALIAAGATVLALWSASYDGMAWLALALTAGMFALFRWWLCAQALREMVNARKWEMPEKLWSIVIVAGILIGIVYWWYNPASLPSGRFRVTEAHGFGSELKNGVLEIEESGLNLRGSSFPKRTWKVLWERRALGRRVALVLRDFNGTVYFSEDAVLGLWRMEWGDRWLLLRKL